MVDHIHSCNILGLCPTLTIPSNGQVIFSKLYEGSYANYSCNPGYDLLGSPVIVCNSTGKWDPAPPICYSKPLQLICTSSPALLCTHLYHRGMW